MTLCWMANNDISARSTTIASNIPDFAPVSIGFGTMSPDTNPMAYRIVNRNVRYATPPNRNAVNLNVRLLGTAGRMTWVSVMKLPPLQAMGLQLPALTACTENGDRTLPDA